MFPMVLTELIYGLYAKKNPIPETTGLQENESIESLQQDPGSNRTALYLAIAVVIIAVTALIIIKRKK